MAEANSSTPADPVNPEPTGSPGPRWSPDYIEYLNSPQWKAKRGAAIIRAGGRCQLCNRGGELHAHHRTYERLGRELLDDLTVLCADCHELFHKHRRVDSMPTSKAVHVDYSAPVLEELVEEDAAGKFGRPRQAMWNDLDGRLEDKARHHEDLYPGFDVQRFLSWARCKPDNWKRWALTQSMSDLNKRCRRSMSASRMN